MHSLNSKLKIGLVLMCSVILMISSCKLDEDFGKAKMSPDYLLPLVYGELDLKNLVKDTSFIKTDPAGYLKVGFMDTIALPLDLGPALNLVQDNADIPTPINFSNAGGVDQMSSEINYNLTFALSLSKLKKLGLNQTTIRIKIENNKTFDFNNMELRIPGLLVNGTPFTTGTFSVPFGTTSENSYSLSNVEWDLTGKLSDTNSIVFLQMPAVVSGPTGGFATFSIIFENPSVKFWQGGSPLLSQLPSIPPVTSSQDVIPAETYKNIKSGSMKLNDVEVDLNFLNTIGIPLNMKLTLATINGVNGTKVQLDTLNLNLTKGNLNNNNDPISAHNVYELNQNTSNLADVISNFPTTIDISVGGGLSFSEPDPLSYYIHQNSNIELLVNGQLPFAISFDNLRLQDTLKFDGFSQDIPEMVELETGELRFKLANGFPYEIEINLNLMNNNADSIGRLASFTMLGANTTMVGGEEMVTTPRQSTPTIVITPELFEKLKTTNYLEIKARLNTPAGVNKPKIYTHYKLGFSAVGRLKVLLDTAKE